jgi:hypothetical protein
VKPFPAFIVFTSSSRWFSHHLLPRASSYSDRSSVLRSSAHTRELPAHAASDRSFTQKKKLRKKSKKKKATNKHNVMAAIRNGLRQCLR